MLSRLIIHLIRDLLLVTMASMSSSIRDRALVKALICVETRALYRDVQLTSSLTDDLTYIWRFLRVVG